MAEAVEVARAAALALGIENGPTYTQVRLADGGATVMELAARLGGGHDAEVCREALGIDPNELALAAALGEPVSVPEPTPSGGACVRFLVPPEGEPLRSRARRGARPRESSTRGSTGGRSSDPSCADPTAGFVLAPSSRDDALVAAARPTQYASRSKMQLSSSNVRPSSSSRRRRPGGDRRGDGDARGAVG